MATWLRRLTLSLALVSFVVVPPIGLPDAEAQNGCFMCKYRYFSGGGFMPPWLLVYCGASETAQDPYWCWMPDDETCLEFGVCGNYVYV